MKIDERPERFCRDYKNNADVMAILDSARFRDLSESSEAHRNAVTTACAILMSALIQAHHADDGWAWRSGWGQRGPAFPGREEIPLRCQDHAFHMWRKDPSGQIERRYVSHPYQLELQAIEEIVDLCRGGGYSCWIDGRSWHYPGWTTRVVLTR